MLSRLTGIGFPEYYARKQRREAIHAVGAGVPFGAAGPNAPIGPLGPAGPPTRWIFVTSCFTIARAYVEGRLTMNTWTDKDGQQRTGLSVSAWQVTALGQIRRRKPKVQSRGEDAVPFDDPLRF